MWRIIKNLNKVKKHTHEIYLTLELCINIIANFIDLIILP